MKTQAPLNIFARNSRERAPSLHSFTLVVIVIVSILAAMLLPALSRVRAEARKTACAGNIRQAGTGFSMFREDNNHYWPMAGGGWHAATLANLERLLKYLENAELFICPATGNAAAELNAVFNTDYTYENNTGVTYRQEWFFGHSQSRAVYADIVSEDTGISPGDYNDPNHRDGSNIMFADTSVRFGKFDDPRDITGVPNPHMRQTDANIYEFAGPGPHPDDAGLQQDAHPQ